MNLRPPDYEPGELPNCSTPLCVVNNINILNTKDIVSKVHKSVFMLKLVRSDGFAPSSLNSPLSSALSGLSFLELGNYSQFSPETPVLTPACLMRTQHAAIGPAYPNPSRKRHDSNVWSLRKRLWFSKPAQ